MFINIVPPQGVVDRLQVYISQEIYPLFQGVATQGEDRPELQFLQALGLHFLVNVLLLSMLTHLFLSSSLSLSYLILAVPMRKCLGKHSCMSSSFPTILNGTSFFRQCNYKCTKENSVQGGDTSQCTIVTLYQLN